MELKHSVMNSDSSAGIKVTWHRQAQAYESCSVYPLGNFPTKPYQIRKRAVRKIVHPSNEMKPPVVSVVSGMMSQTVLRATESVLSQMSIAPSLEEHFPCFYSDEKRKVLKPLNSRNAKTQTNFRESSAQTIPWQPDYKVVQGEPELLMLDFLQWGSGLPAGVADIEMVERVRMKRKWQQRLSSPKGPEDFEKQQNMIEAFEREEWLNREKTIDEINEIRFNLLEKMLDELMNNAECRNEKKMKMFYNMKLKEKHQKMEELKKNSGREKRRLAAKYCGTLSRYHALNITEEFSNYSSDIYLPLIRHGMNPKYGNYLLSHKYKSEFIHADKYSSWPINLVSYMKVKDVKLPGTRLCVRYTKWTTPVLKLLHEQLKEIAMFKKKPPINLRVYIVPPPRPVQTPEIESVNLNEERSHYNVVILQKVMRGRAVQKQIIKARLMLTELITEVKYDTSLQKSSNSSIEYKKKKMLNQHKTIADKQRKLLIVDKTLRTIAGSTVGTLLDFLNKELIKVYAERKVHALALMVERLRGKLEADESGRRQKEKARRLEHDEIFKQTVKINQETVDLYLENIISEGLEFSSKKEAHGYANALAAEIYENEIKDIDTEDVHQNEIIIADMVHQFVLPEVQRNYVRRQTKKLSRNALRTAHEEIYNITDTMPELYLEYKKELLDKERAEGETLGEQGTEASEDISRIPSTDVLWILDNLVDSAIQSNALKRMKKCTVAMSEMDITIHTAFSGLVPLSELMKNDDDMDDID